MKRKNKEKIIYYNDLKNDDFSGTNIKIKPLKDSYKYLHKNPLWQIADFLHLFYHCKAYILFGY